MPVKTDNQLQLRDGHQLGYAEYGDPNGRPVLYFHGMPSSRLEGHNPVTDQVATRLNIRILAIDRPGYGLSDFKPFRMVDWPDRVVEFADRLSLEKFAVMGLSSGPKYVAACAWKIPDRLTAAGMVSANAPLVPEVRASLSSQDRQLYTLARYAPWLLRLLLGSIARNARKNPESILSLFSELCEADKAALAKPEVRQVLAEMTLGAFHQGTRGVAWDWKLEALPWGFPLEDIHMCVSLWHGEADTLVPVAHGRYLARVIPNCQAQFFPQEGHISTMQNHLEEILQKMVPSEKVRS